MQPRSLNKTRGQNSPQRELTCHAELVSASYEIPKQVRNDKIWLYEKLSPRGTLLKAQDFRIITQKTSLSETRCRTLYKTLTETR